MSNPNEDVLRDKEGNPLELKGVSMRDSDHFYIFTFKIPKKTIEKVNRDLDKIFREYDEIGK